MKATKQTLIDFCKERKRLLDDICWYSRECTELFDEIENRAVKLRMFVYLDVDGYCKFYHLNAMDKLTDSHDRLESTITKHNKYRRIVENSRGAWIALQNECQVESYDYHTYLANGQPIPKKRKEVYESWL